MLKYHLAIDIGASGGRHVLGYLHDGKLELEEIYCFQNGMIDKKGTCCWDVERLFQEILTGMKLCNEAGKIPESVGIDAWGADFVLLDKKNRIIGNVVGYGDHRTKGMDKKVATIVSEEELYERTGTSRQVFNTLYQLMSIKENFPKQLLRAESMLMVPDYFHFLLTGNKITEYTNATTTGLVNTKTKNWDYELIHKLGLPEKIFTQILKPGELLGKITKKVENRVGFNCSVILPATHNTGSAVLSVPAYRKNTLYINSGTWTTLGVERSQADCSKESRLKNFTNEGGYDYSFRYLKNIMGLGMIQSVRHEYHNKFSYGELYGFAEAEKDFPSRVDVNDAKFLAPESMIEAIQDFCKTTRQIIPETVGEIAAVIFFSLAKCYRETVEELEEITGSEYSFIHIVGGGSSTEYLNQLTAKATGKKVFAGPSEAAAIGNLTCQMLTSGKFDSIEEARSMIFQSFEIKEYV